MDTHKGMNVNKFRITTTILPSIFPKGESVKLSKG